MGSVPFATTELALRRCAEALGPYVSFQPDGEVDDRRRWTGYLPLHIFSQHPDLVEVRHPRAERVIRDEKDSAEWHFRLRPGVANFRFHGLGYAGPAHSSYQLFRKLRDEGVIAPDVRFQVAFPASSGAVDQFFSEGDEWPVIREAYERGVRDEIQQILEFVPADDLVIQFDLAGEVTDLATGEKPQWWWAPSETWDERFERHVSSLVELAKDLPEKTLLGWHWCYGTWGGWPMVEMVDLGLCVQLSNASLERSTRRVDYLHMPVTPDADERFFEPLRDLRLGQTKLYLGLLHHPDTDEAFRQRVEHASKVASDFGIAAVCGFGRIDPVLLDSVLADHRANADTLAALRAAS